MSVALDLFQQLCEVGNALELLRDTYVPESDQWIWHTEVLGLLDSVIDMLAHSQGIGEAMTKCTVCGAPQIGYPDADVTCPECEEANFAGDPLRQPPKRQRQPEPWWQRERLPLAPHRDGLRALTFVQGPWTWHDDEGIVERPHE